MTLWLYLHFPSLQLDAMYHKSGVPLPPLIIVDNKQNEVVQLSDSAMAEGIKVGMGLGTASSLCAEIQVKAYEESAENRILKRIAHWLYSVTADLALYPPNGLLIRVSGMLTLHPSLLDYWQVLSGHLNRLAISYYYATAYSPFAARMLAKQQLNRISDDKNWLTNKIKQQPLTCGDLTPKVVTSLTRVGIHSFAHLLSLPFSALSKRFNVEVVNYIGQLTGDIQHHVSFYIPPDHFEQYLELCYEVSNNQYLEKPLLKLYKLLEQYLRLKDKLVAEITLVLHQRDNDTLNLAVTAAKGEYKADKWLQLTLLSLESITLAAPVVAITLKGTRIVSKYAQRVDLFQGYQGRVSPEELVSTLVAKLGKDKVKGLGNHPDDRPEVANQLGTPLINKCTPVVQHKLRPSILLPSPVVLSEKVKLMPYPERIVTGWWDNQQVCRDYFIGRTDSGRWLWLFKDSQKRWFVHGVFS